MHRLLPSIGLLLTLSLLGLTAAERNLLDNGDFETRRGKGSIPGWTVDNANFVIEDIRGVGRVLRYRLSQPTQGKRIEQRVPVQSGWVEMSVSARIKAEGVRLGEESWQTPRLNVCWLDAKGEVIGYPGSLSVDRDTDWVSLRTSFAVNPAAAALLIQPAQFGTAGDLWFDDLVVTARKAGELPAHERVHWQAQPVVGETPYRGDMVLNDWWRFAPLSPDHNLGDTQAPAFQTIDAATWGWMRVPGDWGKSKWPPTPITDLIPGTGADWSGFERATTQRAWLEREVTIPRDWKGRAIELALERVSTDAWVYVDGTLAGRVEWPYGTVDLTAHAKPGKTITLRILVLAIPEAGMIRQYMETQTAQVTEKKATLLSAGLIGDVVMRSRPQGAHISDVFVQPSVREQSVTLDIEISDTPKAITADCRIDMLDERGRVEKTFRERIRIKRDEHQVVQLTFPWDDPRLWDLRQPELYTARVQIESRDFNDSYLQEFGFREWWIEGTRFMLNGRPFRMRPALGPTRMSAQAIDVSIDHLLARGFNFKELWPINADRRSAYHNWELYVDRADRKGLPISGVALSINDTVRTWDEPGVPERWQTRMQADLKRYRNHPSSMMWACSANFFGADQDQNPTLIGRTGWNDHNIWWKRNADRAREAIAQIKAFDPTRPVFTHQGAYVGDVHTVNMYLNMTQTQEREEWLSRYAESGEIPFWPVEFGMPVNLTMRRGRNTHSGADRSEPLMTEWAAQQLGRAAYQVEEPNYRRGIRTAYRSDSDDWQFRQPEIHAQAAFQQFVAEDVRRVWRSWRTWGTHGGMLPWNDGHAYEPLPSFERMVDANPFTPGLRGPYFRQEPAGILDSDLTRHQRELPAGTAFIENNSDTLAWIAGGPDAFTNKRHHYHVGDEVAKQVVIINDLPQEVRFSYAISVDINGRSVFRDQHQDVIATAATITRPLVFKLPTSQRESMTSGVITLEATIGERTHTDRFAFTVFDTIAPPASAQSVHLFDPAKTTTPALEALGYQVRQWNRRATPATMPWAIIGQQALSSGNDDLDGDRSPDGATRLPIDLEDYVAQGGQVLVLAQDPQWMQRHWGWRVNPHVMRRAYAVQPGDPMLNGLGDEHLAYWAGAGTVLQGYQEVYSRLRNGKPYHGFHWGNHGSVASAAVEKPHRSGWRPRIETGFDLAYAAVMELDYGAGRVIYCGMDLVDQAPQDPAAARLLAGIIADLEQPRDPVARPTTVYVGSDRGARTLDLLGLIYQRQDRPGQDHDFLITDDRRWANHGRQTVLLAQTALADGRKQVDSFAGCLTIPDSPLTRGLSPSDLRWRVDGPATLLSGPNTQLDGLLRVTTTGDRLLVETQLDPLQFDTQREPYYRYTAWRQTRALAQILANMGASFAMDRAFFDLRAIDDGRIDLSGMWKVRMTMLNPIATSTADIVHRAEMSPAAKQAIQPGFNDRNWDAHPVPSYWDTYGGDFQGRDGEGVYRKTVTIPPAMQGKELLLSLGVIDDQDATYFNGVLVGETNNRNDPRVYRIPAQLTQSNSAVIAVRVYDNYYFGGIYGDDADLWLAVPDYEPPPTPYHPDYRPGFELGDDPYRYYRW